MNKKIAIVSAAIVIAIVAAAFLGRQSARTTTETGNPSASEEATNDSSAATNGKPGTSANGESDPNKADDSAAANTKAMPWGVADPADATAPVSKLSETPLSKEEKKAVATLTSTMAHMIQPKIKPQALVDALTKMNMAPVMAKDFNPYTGKMLVVRTENTLPGTRYFHAQYFEDEDKQQFPQHISIEVRPSKDGMETAMKALEQALKAIDPKADLGKFKFKNPDFAELPLKNNYVASIERLDGEKLKHNPINAYQLPDDIGTIAVRIEQNPHPEHDEHGEDGHDH